MYSSPTVTDLNASPLLLASYQWVPPPTGSIRINTDGTVSILSNYGAAVGILRDSTSSVLLISPSVGNTRSITEFGNSYGNTPSLTTPTSLKITPLTPTLTYHQPRLCQHLNQTKPTPTTQHSPKTTLVTETGRAAVEQGGDNQTKGVPRVLGAESHKRWSGTMQGRVGHVRMGTRNRTVVAVHATDGGGGSVGASPEMER
ncbi:hypothetical protein GQ457_07G004220 [Hibiscus cannabinus]